MNLSFQWILFCFILTIPQIHAELPAPASDEDLTTVRVALNKYFPNKYKIEKLNLDSDGAEKKLSGEVSFFGANNTQLSCTINTTNKSLREVSIQFPTTAKFDIAAIQHVCGPEIRTVLPNSVSSEAGITIRELTLRLTPDGKKVELLNVNLESAAWDFMQMGSFKIQQLAFNLKYQPQNSQQKFTGVIAGTIPIKNAMLTISSNLPKKKEDWKITANYNGEAGNLTVNDVIQAIGGAEATQSIFSIVQGSSFFTNISFPNFTIETIPFSKQVNIAANNDLGTVALVLDAKGKKTRGYLSLKPSSKLVFASVHASLGWLDAIQMPLSESELIVGNQPMELNTKTIGPGIGIRSRIKLPKDIEDLLNSSNMDIRLMGHIADLSTFMLRANLDLNIDLGSGVTMEGIGLGLRSKATEKLFFMDGSMVFPVDAATKLRFAMEVGGDASSSTFQAGLDLEAINDNGDASEWQEPFDLPYVGIRGLGGTVGLNPTTILGRLGLRGNVRLGQLPKKGAEDKRIAGQINLDLDVPKPINSSLACTLNNTTFVRMIEAFKPDIRLQGPVRKLLDSGIENLIADLRPSEGVVRLAGDGKLFGKQAHLDIKVDKSSKQIAASGWVSPIDIKAGKLQILAIKGAQSARPNFNIKLDLDPIFKIDGAINILGLERAGFVEISKNGFTLSSEGSFLNSLSMKATVSGSEFTEAKGLHIKLELKQDILNKAKDAITNFIQTASNGSSAKINEARAKLAEAQRNSNQVEQFILNISDEVLNSYDKVQGAAATAGMMITEKMLGTIDVRRITFEGNANQLESAVSFQIEVYVKGKRFDLEASININNADAKAVAEAIAKKAGDLILEAFSYLEDEFEAVTDALKEFARGIEKAYKEVAKGMEKAYDATTEFFEDVARELDQAWNGETYDAAKTAAELAQYKPGIRHYTVTLEKFVVEAADDGISAGSVIDAIGGGDVRDNTIELYGPVNIQVNGQISVPKGTNYVFWSRNRGNSKSVGQGSTINVNHSKHFYANVNDNITLYFFSRFWEFDDGQKDLADDKIYGSTIGINLREINGTQSYYFHATEKNASIPSKIKVYFKVTAHPIATTAVMRQVIASGDIENLKAKMKKGGNLYASDLDPLYEAARAGQDKMAAFLMGNGFKPNTKHLQAALFSSRYNKALSHRLLIRGAAPNTQLLNQALAKGDDLLATEMMRRGAAPTLSQFNAVIQQRKYSLAGSMLDHGVKPTVAELETAVNAKDLKAAQLITAYGVKGNITLLNNSITQKNKPMYQLLEGTVKPDQSSLLKAVETNDINILQMVFNSGIQATDNQVLHKTITAKNQAMMEMVLSYGGNANEGVSKSVAQSDKNLLMVALKYGGDPNMAIPYAVKVKDAALVQQLLNPYGALPQNLLNEAVKQNNYDFAVLAFNNGAVPDQQIKTLAEQNKVNWVNLYLDHGANPNLAMLPMIQNKQDAVVRRLLDMGADPRPATYMENAARKVSLPLVRMLCEAGASPQPAMGIAVTNNMYNMTSYLLEQGANTQGHLKTAACKGNTNMVKLLLDFGGVPNEGIKCASEGAHEEMTLLLLKYGASPKGLLAHPARAGRLKITQYLVNYGADPSTGIAAAVQGNHTQVANYLLYVGAQPKGLVGIAAQKSNARLVTLLCQYGDDPQKGMGPAAKKGNLKILQICVGFGASAKPAAYIRDAVVYKHPEAISYLIRNGANPNEKYNGEFLIIIACGEKENLPTIKALVDGKADLNVYEETKNRGFTALQLAANQGRKNLEAVQVLVEGGANVNAYNKPGKRSVLQTANKPYKDYLESKGAVKKP